MITKICNQLHNNGVLGILSKVYKRILPPRLAIYQDYKQYFIGNNGLEIGGPSSIFKHSGLFPVYTIARKIDNCNFSHQTIWEGDLKEGATYVFNKHRDSGNQYISEATNLDNITSSSYDFVLSSHTLEHVANPLLALSEWARTLKENGLLVLIVPHRDGTFDCRRPVTSLTHCIGDFEQTMNEGDMTHLEEILELHDFSKDSVTGGFEAFKQRSMKNIANRCLHHHVFDTRLAVELINYTGLHVLAYDAFNPCHIIVLAQKPMSGEAFQNCRVGDSTSVLRCHSPFPSDQHS